MSKIPEQGLKHIESQPNLPCSNTHSLIQVYDNFFTIMSIIYDWKNLKQDMLEHIRAQYGYYKLSAQKLLTKKKLDLADWLTSMKCKDLPADKICLLASTRMLKIHISVDYTTGCWTTFVTTNTNHHYITEMSDIHLIYRGSCKYNLLCRSCDLKTTGHKLLDHKLYNTELIRPLKIILTRIDDCPDNTENTRQTTYDSDTTKLYKIRTPISPEATTNIPTDSETTELYELSTDKEPKIKQTSNDSANTVNDKSTSDKDNKHGYKKQLFKCKTKHCTMRVNSRKDLYQHHKSIHRRLYKCTNCDKKYRTPYSLYQHNYIHQRSSQLFNCTKCGMCFAFKSQLRIHKNSHTKHGKFECMECFTKFKYKHDMYRHLREHTANILACKKCAYTGTQLNLKEHKRQHFKKYNKICPLCKQSFNFRMTFWQHKNHCYQSNSLVY